MNPPAAPSTRDAEDLPEEFLPDIDDLVTEDDIPVDNIFSEKQQRLLTEPLYSSMAFSYPTRPSNQARAANHLNSKGNDCAEAPKNRI